MEKINRAKIVNFLLENYERSDDNVISKDDIFNLAKKNFQNINEKSLLTSIGYNLRFINKNYKILRFGYKGLKVKINYLYLFIFFNNFFKLTAKKEIRR